MEAFGTLGYEECEDGSFEAGYEKVALYAREKPDGSLWPTHAARQLPNQRWTSKLGKLEDIIHDKPEVLSGPLYGEPVNYMRRRTHQSEAA